jgi:hypothetical protein
MYYQAWRVMHIILASRKMEIKKIMAWGQSGQKVSKIQPQETIWAQLFTSVIPAIQKYKYKVSGLAKKHETLRTI